MTSPERERIVRSLRNEIHLTVWNLIAKGSEPAINIPLEQVINRLIDYIVEVAVDRAKEEIFATLASVPSVKQ